MAEKDVKQSEVTEETKPESTPRQDLNDTTKDLIKEALAGAGDATKPWYKRAGFYLIALLLVAAFYAGEQVGADVINAIVQVVQAILHAL